jgi:hypothetical protein
MHTLKIVGSSCRSGLSSLCKTCPTYCCSSVGLCGDVDLNLECHAIGKKTRPGQTRVTEGNWGADADVLLAGPNTNDLVRCRYQYRLCLSLYVCVSVF